MYDLELIHLGVVLGWVLYLLGWEIYGQLAGEIV